MERLAQLETKSTFFWVTVGSLSVAAVGAGDVVTGRDFAFAPFYLIPILMVTWFAGRDLGIAISAIAGITWFIADAISDVSYAQPSIRYWNAAVRLGFFMVVALLLPALRALERERAIARIDDLTGTANRRHFFEAAQTELFRSQRYKHPFTIVYLDLDGFKAVNDRFGHRIGDKALCAVVNRAKSHLRRTDLMARLGGDEFVLLLTETGQEAAETIVPKIRAALLAEMYRNGWPVTFSIGVLTYQGGPLTADQLISRADDLMYSVKNNGKDGVAYGVIAEQPPLTPAAASRRA